VFVIFGLAVLGLAGFLAPDVVGEYDDRPSCTPGARN
jgi:hypothetical protein